MVLEGVYPVESQMLPGLRDGVIKRHGLSLATGEQREKTAAIVEF